MNKLITISVVLLSLNLHGAAPKLEISATGLEGWGKKEGVNISVEDYSHIYPFFDVKDISNIVELKLRLAGIKVTDKNSSDEINISMMPDMIGGRLFGYTMNIRASRKMHFKYNEKEYAAYGSSNEVYGGKIETNYKLHIDRYIEKFLLDYLKANPRKKEEK